MLQDHLFFHTIYLFCFLDPQTYRDIDAAAAASIAVVAVAYQAFKIQNRYFEVGLDVFPDNDEAFTLFKEYAEEYGYAFVHKFRFLLFFLLKLTRENE